MSGTDDLQDDQGLGDDSEKRQNQRGRWRLYGSHLLSAWGARMWEFAIGLVRTFIAAISFGIQTLIIMAPSYAVIGHLGRA